MYTSINFTPTELETLLKILNYVKSIEKKAFVVDYTKHLEHSSTNVPANLLEHALLNEFEHNYTGAELIERTLHNQS
jgi:uncharacterized Fe-S center protein